jgi:hypothetical protein
MAYSISLATVANSIAALSISGVTVKDADEIVTSWNKQANILYPIPNNWITNAKFTVDTYGSNSAEKGRFSCNMNYRFLGTELGNMANFTSAYNNVISKMILIINAIISNDVITGAVDFRFVGVANIGPLPDPAGNVFHGCDLTFMYEEFL